jgi:predicted DNA-binding transcriptional regulator AlpA
MPAAQREPDADALLGEVRAAELLCLSQRTLQAWRAKGGGPAFVRAGRAVRYRRRDLIAWIEAHTVALPPARPRRSDSE